MTRSRLAVDSVLQLTGDALAAKELLRHKNLAVTTDKYVKTIPEALLKGIKLRASDAASFRRAVLGLYYALSRYG